MARRIKVPMSSARGRLFELADLVRQSSDDTAVVFEHRGSKDHVVLVREARLDYLESRVAALEQRVEKPFTVRGSLKTKLPDKDLDELLRQIRREWSPTPSKKVG